MGAGGFTGSRSATASYAPANAFKLLLFDVTNHAEWKSQILTDLRFDPTGSTAAIFDVDWFALSDVTLPLTDPSAPPTSGFYRVRVEVP